MQESITSQEIVDRYGASFKGQQLLFPDADIVLRNTPFQKTEDDNWNRLALVHWWMNVYSPVNYAENNTTQLVYKSWSSPLYEYFKFARSQGGYIPETNQQAVQLSCYKKEPLEPQLTELRLWLKHAKPYFPKRNWRAKRENGQTGKYVDILEHNLSLYDSFNLMVYSETDIDLINRYGEPRNFKTLENAVNFVKDRLWYKKRLDRT
jgi:hypothetical protein